VSTAATSDVGLGWPSYWSASSAQCSSGDNGRCVATADVADLARERWWSRRRGHPSVRRPPSRDVRVRPRRPVLRPAHERRSNPERWRLRSVCALQRVQPPSADRRGNLAIGPSGALSSKCRDLSPAQYRGLWRPANSAGAAGIRRGRDRVRRASAVDEPPRPERPGEANNVPNAVIGRARLVEAWVWSLDSKGDDYLVT
jgi:hypothetical protein